MNVIMIFIYGKRFRFAPSFNDPNSIGMLFFKDFLISRLIFSHVFFEKSGYRMFGLFPFDLNFLSKFKAQVKIMFF